MSRILGLWPADLPRKPEHRANGEQPGAFSAAPRSPQGMDQPPLLDLLAVAAGPKRTVEVAPLDADGRVRIVVRDDVRIVAAERGEWDGAARRAIAALFALGLGRVGA